MVLLFEVWCCVLDAKEMLKNVLGRFVSRGVCGNGGRNSRPPCLYVPASCFRSGQPHSAPRSFFGVEDYLDDDNSRLYTYQKEKKSKNPYKHISFKQRTVAFMEPFTLDIFISKRFVQASITHRVTSKQVAVAGIKTSRLHCHRGATYLHAWLWADFWQKGLVKPMCTLPFILHGRGTSSRGRLELLLSPSLIIESISKSTLTEVSSD